MSNPNQPQVAFKARRGASTATRKPSAGLSASSASTQAVEDDDDFEAGPITKAQIPKTKISFSSTKPVPFASASISTWQEAPALDVDQTMEDADDDAGVPFGMTRAEIERIKKLRADRRNGSEQPDVITPEDAFRIEQAEAEEARLTAHKRRKTAGQLLDVAHSDADGDDTVMRDVQEEQTSMSIRKSSKSGSVEMDEHVHEDVPFPHGDVRKSGMYVQEIPDSEDEDEDSLPLRRLNSLGLLHTDQKLADLFNKYTGSPLTHLQRFNVSGSAILSKVGTEIHDLKAQVEGFGRRRDHLSRAMLTLEPEVHAAEENRKSAERPFLLVSQVHDFVETYVSIMQQCMPAVEKLESRVDAAWRQFYESKKQSSLLTEMAHIRQAASAIFVDADAFTSLGHVYGMFSTWRSEDAISYNQAFADVALPSMLGPLVRYYLIYWELENCRDPEALLLSKRDWFTSLLKFGPEICSRLAEVLLVPPLERWINSMYSVTDAVVHDAVHMTLRDLEAHVLTLNCGNIGVLLMKRIQSESNDVVLPKDPDAWFSVLQRVVELGTLGVWSPETFADFAWVTFLGPRFLPWVRSRFANGIDISKDVKRLQQVVPAVVLSQGSVTAYATQWEEVCAKVKS